MKPFSSLVAGPPQFVSEIIDHSTASWREDMIQQVFLPVDAEAILQIPLCTRQVDDFWAWHEDPKGRFSVRSAYRMILKTKISCEAWLEEREDPSNSEAESKGWLSLWKTTVPPKLRFFAWRLAQHSLPTGDVLLHRNMSSSCLCPLCGAPDNWRHSLLECSASRCVWALSNAELVEHMTMTTETDAKLWRFAMSDSLPPEQFILMTVTLWAIWSVRRKVIHEDIFQTPFGTDRFIKSYLADIEFLQKKDRPHAISTPRARAWLPPPHDHMKTNVDAAISRAGNFGAIGVICRDEAGMFLGASALVIRNIFDPQVLETLAIREALALADDLYINKMLVVLDCKVAIDAIKEGSSANFDAIVQEIRARASNFSSCIFSHEYRTSNVEAHNLAKYAWLGQPGDLVFSL